MFIPINLCLASNNYAQETKISISNRNETIKNILKQIEEQTEYVFIFQDQDVNDQLRISIDLKDKTIYEVLNTLFKGTGNSYKITDRQVYITKPKNSTSNSYNAKASQQKGMTLKGKIVDTKGEPLIGVSIRLKENPSIGISTNLDGEFTLSGITENATLVITYIGMEEVTYKVTNDKFINITMKENIDVLNEVVVVGYGVQKRINLSGSVATVSSKTLENRPVTNAIQALQGAAPGLNIINNSGQATSAPSMNIRGYASINGGNKTPLIVIDGVASSLADFKDINPQDIEDISILKDAASAAIYGARAGFGVALVTTKGGKNKKNEKLKINYDNNFAFRKLGIKPDIVTDPATVVEMRNIFAYPWYTLYGEDEIQYAAKRSADPSISPYFLNKEGYWKYFGNTNWFDEAYRDWGFSTNHNFSLSGATDVVSYFLSAGYNRQDGLLKEKNDIFNRYNLRSKLNVKITDWWQIGNNTSYASTDYDKPRYLGSDYYWAVSRKNPLDMPRNPDGSWTNTGADMLGRMREGGRSYNLFMRLQTQFTTQINLFKDILTINGNFALNRYNGKTETGVLSTEYKTGPDIAPLKYDEVTSASESHLVTDNIMFDAYANYKQTFANKHYVNAMVGFNQEEYKSKQFSASIKDLVSESLPNISLGNGERDVSSSRSEYALRSLFYRLNYIFDDKYIIEHNGRYDGSSRFQKNDRFVYNPSLSIAWVASREKFFEPLSDVISHLKFRLSYGQLGNQDIGNYEYIKTMGYGKTSWILEGKQPYYASASGLAASSFTWETVRTKNLGIDLNLFDNRLTTTFDYYQRATKDMLTTGTPKPSVLGTSVPKENAANLETKGFELSLGWKDSFTLAGKPFNYSATFMLWDSQTEIKKFDNPTGDLSNYYKGEKIGSIWGLTTLGYFQSAEDVAGHADQKTVTAYPGTFKLEAGDLKFLDKNEDGKVDWGKWTLEDHGDYDIIGNTTPRYNYSFNLSADWNNFDINLFLQGVGKRDYYPQHDDLFFWGVYSQPWSNITKGNMDYWTPENTNAYFPRRKAYAADVKDRELAANQTKYLQDASYLRLKNITVGYTLPRTLTRKIKIDKLRVYFSGENLFEFTGLDKHYKVDPEGLSGQTYPFQRSVSFGLNVSF